MKKKRLHNIKPTTQWREKPTDAALLRLIDMQISPRKIALVMGMDRNTVEHRINLATKTREQLKREETPRYRTARRKCLRCHNSFESTWCGDRICQSCRPRVRAKSDAGPFADDCRIAGSRG